MYPEIIEYLIELGQNMVSVNLGSLLNKLDYNFFKQKIKDEEWEYIEDTIFGPCTKGFMIDSDKSTYRIMFIDYNNIKNRHLVNIKDDILIVEVISLDGNKRNLFINRKYYHEPFENDYIIEIKEAIQK